MSHPYLAPDGRSIIDVDGVATTATVVYLEGVLRGLFNYEFPNGGVDEYQAIAGVVHEVVDDLVLQFKAEANREI